MAKGKKEVRYASPNERRTITREHLDYYRSLYVGGIYSTHDPSNDDLTSRGTFLPGLRRCLKDHQALSVTVKDSATEKPYYAASPIADLSRHIDILPTVENKDELDAIEKASRDILDTKPFTDAPAWKIVVLPLRSADEAQPSKCFIAFAFSHSVGDGISGLAFQKSFLAGMQDPIAEQYHKAAKGAMPPPFDTKKNLPISLSYLLAPALGQYLPKFVSRCLGLRAAVSEIGPTTWLGNGTVFAEKDLRSGVRAFRIDGSTVTKMVEACREHNTKLTSLLHQIIIHALSASLPNDGKVDSFASQTAINMRHHVKVSNDEMGLYVTGFFDVHSRSSDTKTIWSAAQRMNEDLHACSNQLKDQSIGLLRYLVSMRSWMTGKLNGPRDCSYELSNLLAFDSGPQPEDAKWSLANMVFAQPANVTGAPLTFNIVARKGGDLVCTITWQIGALGTGDEEKEGLFVDSVIKEAVKCVDELI